MTFKELEQLYNRIIVARAKPIKPIHLEDHDTTKPLPDTYVFDPDQTVNWNRQQVALYNEALDNNKKIHANEVHQAEENYRAAYNEFVLNDPEYGNGELTPHNLQRILSFMYDYCEDDYNYENGFHGHMCTLQSLIEIWRHVY